MWLSRKRSQACVLGTAVLAWTTTSSAEITLVESKDNGFTATTDGRVNGFVSHIWGDNRPDGLGSLPWVGFNEAGDSGQADSDGKLRRTRIRSGYVPSTFALNLRKQMENGLTVSSRVEIGMQIANVDPTFVANPTWMDPRSVYLDIAGNWGSVRVGRDMGLFPRGNLFMNYELGHAYGVGFPCAYEKVFGGACGHVGFGVLWPDYHAQMTYSTPNFGDIFQVSAGIFDPRTVPTYNWTQTSMPRFEGEAVARHDFVEGWGFKAWANGVYQQVGIGYDQTDPNTGVETRQTATQAAHGFGGGVIGYLGPVKAGVSGYAGKGMDGFEFLTFNPILVGQASVDPQDRRFRPSNGILAEISVTFFNTWVMAGFGQANLDRVPSDIPIETVNAFPLIRTQRGISAGIFHRMDSVVLGLDYFNAHYGFDPRVVQEGDAPPQIVEVEQNVNILNAGATLEW